MRERRRWASWPASAADMILHFTYSRGGSAAAQPCRLAIYTPTPPRSAADKPCCRPARRRAGVAVATRHAAMQAARCRIAGRHGRRLPPRSHYRVMLAPSHRLQRHRRGCHAQRPPPRRTVAAAHFLSPRCARHRRPRRSRADYWRAGDFELALFLSRATTPRRRYADVTAGASHRPSTRGGRRHTSIAMARLHGGRWLARAAAEGAAIIAAGMPMPVAEARSARRQVLTKFGLMAMISPPPAPSLYH